MLFDATIHVLYKGLFHSVYKDVFSQPEDIAIVLAERSNPLNNLQHELIALEPRL